MDLIIDCGSSLGVSTPDSTKFTIYGQLYAYTEVTLWNSNEEEYCTEEDLLGITEACYLQEWEWSGAPGTAPGGNLSFYIDAMDYDDCQYSWVERAEPYTSSTAETYAFGSAAVELDAWGSDSLYYPGIGRVYSPSMEVDENGSFVDLISTLDESEITWLIDNYHQTPVEEDNKIVYKCAIYFEEELPNYQVASALPYICARAYALAGAYSQAYINTEQGEKANTWSVQQSNLEFSAECQFSSN